MDNMAISGKYRVYEDGILISEVSNLLTTAGKRELLGILAGTSSRISRLGLGVVPTHNGDTGTNPAVTDATLFFPLVDTPIDFSVPLFGGASSKVVYKARLAEGVSGVIHEIGCYNGPEINEPLLVSFGDDIEDLTSVPGLAGGSSANDVRIGPVSPLLSTTTPLLITQPMQAGPLLSTDTIVLAVKPTNTTVQTVAIALKDSTAKNATRTYTTANNANYQVISQAVSTWTIDTGFDWNDIASCSATKGAAANNIIVDGLAVLAPLQSGQLLSHAKFTTPLVKRAGVRMDIEYELTLNLG